MSELIKILKIESEKVAVILAWWANGKINLSQVCIAHGGF